MFSWRRITSLAAPIVILAVQSATSAQITALWRQNTITPNAIAADPALANMQSWSLMATTTGNWAVAGMRARLPEGNVYYHPAQGGNTKPSAATIAAFPHVEFDTYLTSPGDQGGGVGAPNLLGYHCCGSPSFGGPNDLVPGLLNMAWGDLVVDPPGTYEIARLTFPLGVLPDVANLTPPVGILSATSQVSPDATAIIPDIPEPTSISLILAAGLMMLRHRASSVVALT